MTNVRWRVEWKRGLKQEELSNLISGKVDRDYTIEFGSNVL
jgi:hypothetical protein